MPTIVSKLHIKIDPNKVITNKGLQPNGPVQKRVDTECIRLMQPYIPMDQGVLTGAFQQTQIGSGRIIQSTPYARYQYYGELYVDPQTGKGAFHDPISGRFWSRPNVQKIPSGRSLNYNKTRHPQAGPRWFDRMKADHIQDLLEAIKEEIKWIS